MIAELARQAGDRADDELMSHGDIDQKNVLLTSDGPVLCDWDVATPLVPRSELADVAMSMACWSEFDIAREVVRAYRGAGGVDTEIEPRDFGPTLTSSLDWLVFNVERASGLRTVAADEAELGRRLVPQLVEGLPHEVDVALQVREVLR